MTIEQKEKIQRMRCDGMGYGQIATVLGISKETVKSFLRRNPVPVCAKDVPAENIPESTDAAMDGVLCRQCGTRLIQKPKQKPKQFCSDACRLAWWRENSAKLNRKAVYTIRCEGCGKEFESYGNKLRKYCGHACYIKKRFGGAEHDERAV
jgi:rRNA maturation endonuclease Nob1